MPVGTGESIAATSETAAPDATRRRAISKATTPPMDHPTIENGPPGCWC